MPTKIVKVIAKVELESEKAFLLSIAGENKGWVSKSKLVYGSQAGNNIAFEMSERLAMKITTKKGYIMKHGVYIGDDSSLKGKEALLQFNDESVSGEHLLAQFDDIRNLPIELTHGWTSYYLFEFKIDEKEKE